MMLLPTMKTLFRQRPPQFCQQADGFQTPFNGSRAGGEPAASVVMAGEAAGDDANNPLLSGKAASVATAAEHLTKVRRLISKIILRSEEQKSEHQSLMRITYAVIC